MNNKKILLIKIFYGRGKLMNKDPRWEASPHSLAKIKIVEEYLKAWLPILSRWNDRIVYIDGFSGPGEYLGGEKGSPLAALDTAINHSHIDNFKEVKFLFIEKDEDCLNYLKNLLEKRDLPGNIDVTTFGEEFEDVLTKILDHVENKGVKLAPTFLFIDPFGIKGIKFSTLERFMSNPKCEVFLTYMIESINRFKKHPAFEEHLNNLYGSEVWKSCLELPENPKIYTCLVEKFEKQLNRIAKYKWRFEMVDERDKSIYYLYYGTNDITGLDKMKEAMWKIEPTGSYRFQSRFQDQISLFEKEINLSKLKGDLIRIFKNKTASIEQIEHAVVANTDFRKTHTRKALKELEKEEDIEIVESSRKKRFFYPEGTIIKFK